MFLEEVEYEDPEVGFRYKAYLPVTSHRFIDHIVGQVQVSGPNGLTTTSATFTGDRRLHELVVNPERKGVECDAQVATDGARGGAPGERGGGETWSWKSKEAGD